MARKSRRKTQNLEIDNKQIEVSGLSGWIDTAVYARMSVDKGQRDSTATQVEMMKQYMQEHSEYRLVDTYIDNGYSGTDFDRPAFVRLMEDVKRGKIQCILVKDLSRFGRNYIEVGYFIETILPNLNVRLIAINDDFDSSREEDRTKITVAIKNMINEMYAKDASKKRADMFELHFRLGDTKIARSIYGYTVDKEENVLVENKETAPIVKTIFRWYVMGYSTGDIVKRLKAMQVLTPFAYKALNECPVEIPHTDRWTGDRVKCILLNEAYIGNTVNGKRNKALYKNIPEHHVAPDKWIIHEGTHQPLIVREDFDQAQKIWKENSDRVKEYFRKGRERGTSLIDSFPGKIKCMDCNQTMTYHRYTNGNRKLGIRRGFYVCKDYDSSPGYCGQSIHEDIIKITVMDQIRNIIAYFADKKEVLKKIQDGIYEQGSLYTANIRIQNLKYKLSVTEDKSATLYIDFSDGLLDEEEYQYMKEKYILDKQKIKKEILSLEADMRTMRKTVDAFLEYENQLEQNFKEEGFNQVLVDELIDAVYVSKNGNMEIRFTCGDVFQRIMEITE